MGNINLEDVTPKEMPSKIIKIFRGVETVELNARTKETRDESRGFILAATVGEAPTRYAGRTLRWDAFPAWDAPFESADSALDLARFVINEWKTRSKQRKDDKAIDVAAIEVPMCAGIEPPRNSSRLQVPMTLEETYKIHAIQRACQQAGTELPGANRPVLSLNDTFRYLLSLLPSPKLPSDQQAS